MEHSELRAGDDDRRRALAQLERHFVDGRLTSEEYDERVSRALDARTFGDLDAVLRDLPAVPSSRAEAHAEPRGERIGLWGHEDFRRHLLSYVLVMALLVAIWLLTSPGGYFWPAWPMLGWGIGVASHGLARVGWLGGRRGNASRGDRIDRSQTD
jgi:hypothetical protein